jgi:hypothetical protein
VPKPAIGIHPGLLADPQLWLSALHGTHYQHPIDGNGKVRRRRPRGIGPVAFFTPQAMPGRPTPVPVVSGLPLTAVSHGWGYMLTPTPTKTWGIPRTEIPGTSWNPWGSANGELRNYCRHRSGTPNHAHPRARASSQAALRRLAQLMPYGILTKRKPRTAILGGARHYWSCPPSIIPPCANAQAPRRAGAVVGSALAKVCSRIRFQIIRDSESLPEQPRPIPEAETSHPGRQESITEPPLNTRPAKNLQHSVSPLGEPAGPAWPTRTSTP